MGAEVVCPTPRGEAVSAGWLGRGGMSARHAEQRGVLWVGWDAPTSAESLLRGACSVQSYDAPAPLG